MWPYILFYDAIWTKPEELNYKGSIVSMNLEDVVDNLDL